MKFPLPGTLAAFNIVVLLCTSAQAEMTAHEVLDYISAPDNEAIRVYFKRLVEGVEWTNAMLANQGRERLYCAPATITLTDEQCLDILRRAGKRTPSVASSPAPAVLLKSLQIAFPCPTR
jgi:hypothetical protein